MENQIKSNFEKIISKLNFTNAQKEIKEKNIDNFLKKGFQNKRLEDWKFSDLKQIILNNFDDLNFLNKTSNPINSKYFDDFNDKKSSVRIVKHLEQLWKYL